MASTNSFHHFTTSGCDVQCPHCFDMLDVEWDTEYGDPLDGAHHSRCPSCEGEFTMNVGVVTKVNFSVGIPQ